MGGERGLTWQEYGENVQTCIRQVMRERDGDKFPVLLSNVRATLRMLSRRDGVGMLWEERYGKLCVLEKRGWGSARMIQRLWGTESVNATVEDLYVLTDLGLCEVENQRINGEIVVGVRIHDLLHDVAREIAKESGEVKDVYRRLLDSYGVDLSAEGTREWCSSRIEVDHFIHQNLARLLVHSGHGKELIETLLWPAWVKRQMEVSGIRKLEDDFDLGIKLLKGWREKGLEKVKQLSIKVDGEGINEKSARVEKALKMIKEAARLGSHLIMKDGREAYFQMQGRLVEIGKKDKIVGEYLDRIRECEDGPSLRAVNGFLGAPGGALVGIVSLGSAAWCMARLGDSGRFVCGCSGGRVVIVNVLGEIELEWDAHEETVWSVAASNDGMTIVTGSHDKTAKMWRTADGTHLKTFFGHVDWFNSVAFSKDGRRVALGGRDGTRFWDVESGMLLKEVEGDVWSLAISTNGEFALLGGTSGIRKCKLDLMQSHRMFTRPSTRQANRDSSIRPPRKGILGWCCVNSGKNEDTESFIHSDENFPSDASDRDVVAALQPANVWSMSLIHNDTAVLIGCWDGTIRMIDVESLEQLEDRLRGHSHVVRCIAASEDERYIISGSDDGTVRLWDMERREEFYPPLGGHALVTGVCFAEGSTRVVSCADDGNVKLWDLSRENIVQHTPYHEDTVSCVKFLSCGSRILSGSWDKTVRMWDAKTGQQVGDTFRGHEDHVNCIAAFADGGRAVSGSNDKTLRLWNVDTGEQVRILQGHTDSVACVIATSDGTRVVSGSSDGTVRVWDLTCGGNEHRTMEGHRGKVCNVFLSDDERDVISASFGEIIVWSLERCEEVRRMARQGADELGRVEVMGVLRQDEHGTSAEEWDGEDEGGSRGTVNNSRVNFMDFGTLDCKAWCDATSHDGRRFCAGLMNGGIAIMTVEP